MKIVKCFQSTITTTDQQHRNKIINRYLFIYTANNKWMTNEVTENSSRLCSLCNREMQLCHVFLKETSPTIWVRATNVKIPQLHRSLIVINRSVIIVIQRLVALVTTPTTIFSNLFFVLAAAAPFGRFAALLLVLSFFLPFSLGQWFLDSHTCWCCWRWIVHVWSPCHSQIHWWCPLFLTATFHGRYKFQRSLQEREIKNKEERTNGTVKKKKKKLIFHQGSFNQLLWLTAILQIKRCDPKKNLYINRYIYKYMQLSQKSAKEYNEKWGNHISSTKTRKPPTSLSKQKSNFPSPQTTFQFLSP